MKFSTKTISAIGGLFCAGSVLAQEAEPDIVSSRYGDWTVNCTSVESGPDSLCQMQQQLSIRASGKLLAEVAVARAPKGGVFRAVLRVPLDAWLRTPATLLTGKEELAQADYFGCGPSGCLADVEIDKQTFERFLAVGELALSFETLGRKMIAIPLSVKGLSDAGNVISNE